MWVWIPAALGVYIASGLLLTLLLWRKNPTSGLAGGFWAFLRVVPHRQRETASRLVGGTGSARVAWSTPSSDTGPWLGT